MDVLSSQFCEHYSEWCDENAETLHFKAAIGEKMEVDFAGKTFEITDPLTGEIYNVVVFVAVLPYSQYIYAEGMLSAKEPQWMGQFSMPEDGEFTENDIDKYVFGVRIYI